MRPLSVREKVLLSILCVLVAVSAYLLLFYRPMSERIADLESQVSQSESQLLDSQVMVQQEKKMKAELEEIFSESDQPVSLAPYDNLKPLMVELHRILDRTDEYSLTFGTADQEETIVKRGVSLQFRTASYSQAKQVLQDLSDCKYRCMLDDVEISMGEDTEVSATMIFFEYQ